MEGGGEGMKRRGRRDGAAAVPNESCMRLVLARRQEPRSYVRAIAGFFFHSFFSALFLWCDGRSVLGSTDVEGSLVVFFVDMSTCEVGGGRK